MNLDLRRWRGHRRRSALRIPPIRGHLSHLPPFAMWTAFPSADYCGGSVALGLAPRRQSRVPYVWDVDRVASGAPSVSLRSYYRDPVPSECFDDSGSTKATFREHRGETAVVPGPTLLQNGHWGSTSMGFAIPLRSRPACSLTASEQLAFTSMLWSPAAFALG